MRARALTPPATWPLLTGEPPSPNPRSPADPSTRAPQPVTRRGRPVPLQPLCRSVSPKNVPCCTRAPPRRYCRRQATATSPNVVATLSSRPSSSPSAWLLKLPLPKLLCLTKAKFHHEGPSPPAVITITADPVEAENTPLRLARPRAPGSDNPDPSMAGLRLARPRSQSLERPTPHRNAPPRPTASNPVSPMPPSEALRA
uniref:Uncharacterized protein n=1 Tax=Setaria viridis TaxID=4556 RepID=A0A4U6VWK0_SETVI|nr:hypothetical protein SEVIR_2G164900v2 [Setaria viridis]